MIIKAPRAGSKADVASSHFIYSKPSSITQNFKTVDPTPTQRMRARGRNRARNDAFKAERDEFFHRLYEEKQSKQLVEYESAVMIQAAFRGFRQRGRPETLDENTGAMQSVVTRQYARLPPSIAELNMELTEWQSTLNLKPIPGLTLVSHGHNARRQERFELAASLRIQCFFRMIYAKIIVERARRRHKAMKRFDSALVITRLFSHVLARKQKARRDNEYKHMAAIQIQTAFRIFSSRRFVRKVLHMKKHVLRQNDAAVRMQRWSRQRIDQKRTSGAYEKDQNFEDFIKVEADLEGNVLDETPI